MDWFFQDDDADNNKYMNTPDISPSSSASIIMKFTKEITIPRFPPEEQFGNCEYKLHLFNITEDHIKKLSIQLQWRIEEDQEMSIDGSRGAMYFLGVCDDGELVGLDDNMLEGSIASLKRCCDLLEADLSFEVFRLESKYLRPGYRIARVSIRTKSNALSTNFEEVRITTLGHFQSGKSTLLAVLKTGILDDGSGLARMHVAKHKHEIDCGRTSSVSPNILEYDELIPNRSKWKKNNSSVADEDDIYLVDDVPFTMGAGPNLGFLHPSTITNHIANALNPPLSSSPKLVNLLDTAGHPRYFKSTLKGLCARAPKYAMITMSALLLVEQNNISDEWVATCDFIRLACALGRQIFIVATKIDCIPSGSRMQEKYVSQLRTLVQSCTESKQNHHPTNIVPVTDDTLACDCALALSNGDNIVPVFFVSSVTGESIGVFHRFLGLLEDQDRVLGGEKDAVICDEERVIFHVAETFRLRKVGDVVEGWLQFGSICVGDELYLGPGNSKVVTVKSIYTANRTSVGKILKGQSASLSIVSTTIQGGKEETLSLLLRRGSVLSNKAVEGVREFAVEAEKSYFNSLKPNREFVAHFNASTQAVKVVESVVKNDQVIVCKLRFLYREEYLLKGTRMIIFSTSLKDTPTMVLKII